MKIISRAESCLCRDISNSEIGVAKQLTAAFKPFAPQLRIYSMPEMPTEGTLKLAAGATHLVDDIVNCKNELWAAQIYV